MKKINTNALIAAGGAILMLLLGTVVVLTVSILNTADRAEDAEKDLREARDTISQCQKAVDNADEAFLLTADAFDYVSTILDGDYFSLTSGAAGLGEVADDMEPVALNYTEAAEKCHPNRSGNGA